MKSQVLLLEALLVFILIATLLLLTVPLHQDISPYVRAIREMDENQVARLLDG